MKQSEIFYFDVDGTLLHNQSNTIRQSTKDALKALKDQGYKLALCTGRTLGSIKDTEMRHLVEWDAYILSNGATVLDKDFKILKNSVCEPEFIKALQKAYPFPILLEGDQNYLLNGSDKALDDFLSIHDMKASPLDPYTNEVIPKITLPNINHFEGGFNNPLFKDYTFEINAYSFYEIHSKDAGKDQGIKTLNEILNIKHCTFFGDGRNDIEALKYANFGVAMGNAVDDAKEVANYVTTDVDDDGIYNALKHFEVI